MPTRSWAPVPGTPPSARYAKPEACTVIARHAMLNRVRWTGFLVFIRNVHWLQALATATSMVSFGPSSNSAAKSTAYETDIVEPLLASGKLTLNADVTADMARRNAKRGRLLKVDLGPSDTTSRAPSAMVAPIYKRAGSGKERMGAAICYEPHTALVRMAITA